MPRIQKRGNIVTVTKLSPCRWCGRPVEQRTGPGRPRQFCRRSCRQRDYESRRRAAAHGLDESEIVLTRAELDTLRDHLFVLACAMQDVRRDLAGSPSKADYAAAVAWLLDACSPLVERP